MKFTKPQHTPYPHQIQGEYPSKSNVSAIMKTNHVEKKESGKTEDGVHLHHLDLHNLVLVFFGKKESD